MCGFGRSGGDSVIATRADPLVLPAVHVGVSLTCTCARHRSSLGWVNAPWRSYRWFLPGLSLCSGERKGHFEVSPLLQLRVPPCLIQGGSHREGEGRL